MPPSLPSTQLDALVSFLSRQPSGAAVDAIHQSLNPLPPRRSVQRWLALLVAQVTAPVRFTEISAYLIAHGVTTFVEVGPGKALIGMVKRAPGLIEGTRLLNVEDEKSLAATLTALG